MLRSVISSRALSSVQSLPGLLLGSIRFVHCCGSQQGANHPTDGSTCNAANWLRQTGCKPLAAQDAAAQPSEQPQQEQHHQQPQQPQQQQRKQHTQRKQQPQPVSLLTWPSQAAGPGHSNKLVRYQGSSGGCVVVPRYGSKLWQATYAGNVPSQWYLDNSSSALPSSSSSSPGSVPRSSSSSPSSVISSWTDLVATSNFIQQNFRLSGPSAVHCHYKNGLLVYGRQRKLRRAYKPAPRAALNSLARQQLLHKLVAPQQLYGVRSLYVHNRLRMQSGASILQQQQQQQPVTWQQGQQLQSLTLQQQQREATSPHWVRRRQQQQQQQQTEAVQPQQALQQHSAQQQQDRKQRLRFWQRSHAVSRLDAAYAARQRVWAVPSSSSYEIPAGCSKAAAMGTNDVVFGIYSAEQYKLAERYAAAVSTVTRCMAQRDKQGQLLPLPRSCRAAAISCRAAASSTSTSSSSSSSGANAQPSWSRCVCNAACDAGQVAGRSRIQEVYRRARNSDQVWRRTAGQRAAAVTAEEEAKQAAAATGIYTEEAAQLLQQQLQPGTPAWREDNYGINVNRSSTDGLDAINRGMYHQLFEQINVRRRSLNAQIQSALQAAKQHQALGSVLCSPDESSPPSSAELSDSELDSDDDDVADYDDENVWDSDDEQENDVEDADEEDCELHEVFIEGELEVSPEVEAAIAEPHVFRNSAGVIYGFWSKCPLG